MKSCRGRKRRESEKWVIIKVGVLEMLDGDDGATDHGLKLRTALDCLFHEGSLAVEALGFGPVVAMAAVAADDRARGD